MNKQRIAMLICAVAGIIATFMPWFNMPLIGSVNGTQANNDGWITLALFAVPLLLSMLGNRTKSLEGAMLFIAIAAGLVAAGIAVYRIIDFKNKISPLEDNAFGKMLTSTVSVGAGLYLVAVAGLAVLITAFALKDKQTAAVNARVEEPA